MTLHIRISSMEVVNILETPPTFFNLILKFALSLLASLLAFHYPKPVQDRRSSVSFDIDPQHGFFPPKPLPRLCGPYAVWENALDAARGKLSLGEDDSDEAVAKRLFGRQWRTAIASVSFLFLFLFFFSEPDLSFLSGPLLMSHHCAMICVLPSGLIWS